jgi:hypothetical protein
MAITIKCPDCGHTKQSDDGEPETCPECEGTMAPPAKKKYQAKSTTLEEEAKKKKRDADDDDDAPKKKDKPKPKRKTGEGGSTRDGTRAEALELNPGFGNSKLMAQVEDELSRGEVLHWAGRMRPEIAKKGASVARIVGIVLAVAGLVFVGIVLGVAPGMAKLAVIVPVLFVVIGIVLAAVIPVAHRSRRTRMRAARRGTLQGCARTDLTRWRRFRHSPATPAPRARTSTRSA